MGAARLRLVSRTNPLTYIMEAMRWLVSGTGEPGSVIVAFALTFTAGVGGAVLAARSVRNVLN
jgi:ABC-type polysaccharide/polyol phosphate export permease